MKKYGRAEYGVPPHAIIWRVHVISSNSFVDGASANSRILGAELQPDARHDPNKERSGCTEYLLC
jgi:hypothetical protein